MNSHMRTINLPPKKTVLVGCRMLITHTTSVWRAPQHNSIHIHNGLLRRKSFGNRDYFSVALFRGFSSFFRWQLDNDGSWERSMETFRSLAENVLISSSIREPKRCFFIGKWTPYPTPTQHKLCMSGMLCCCESTKTPEKREGGETMMMRIKRAKAVGGWKCFVCAPAEEHGIIGKAEREVDELRRSQAASAAISHTQKRLVNFFFVFSFYSNRFSFLPSQNKGAGAALCMPKMKLLVVCCVLFLEFLTMLLLVAAWIW